jgi:hypothetical protein
MKNPIEVESDQDFELSDASKEDDRPIAEPAVIDFEDWLSDCSSSYDLGV